MLNNTQNDLLLSSCNVQYPPNISSQHYLNIDAEYIYKNREL